MPSVPQKTHNARFFVSRNIFTRALRALLFSMLTSAIIHVAILIVHAIRSGDLSPLNYFRILEIDSFFPALTSMQFSIFWATLLFVGVFTTFFLRIKTSAAKIVKE